MGSSTENKWFVPAIIVVAVLYLIQSEFDIFNRGIRGATNFISSPHYGTNIFIPLLFIALIWYYFSQKKSSGQKEVHH